MAEPAPAWGTCTFCGDPFPPGAARCPTCGNPKSVGAGLRPSLSGLTRKERYHFRVVQLVKISLIIGAIVGLSYLMVSAAVTPNAPAADPLTTSGTWVIGPANFTALSGDITGDDLVIGNYSVIGPPGGAVDLLIFNDTEYGHFLDGRPAVPLENVSGDAHAQLLFSAPYTDNFHLVWRNPYPAGSGITIVVYVVTSYESNALVE